MSGIPSQPAFVGGGIPSFTTVPTVNVGQVVSVGGILHTRNGAAGYDVVTDPSSISFAASSTTVAPQRLKFTLSKAERLISPRGADALQVAEFTSSTDEIPGWIVATAKAWRQIDVLPDRRLVACAANGDRVHWSYDGVSWTPFMQCPRLNWSGLCVVKGGAYVGRIIAGSTDGGIWYSDDGATWTLGLSGVACRALTSSTDGAIYAGGSSSMGMRKSVDGGVTWTVVSAWKYGDIYQALGTDGGTTIIAGNNGGQARSSSNGGASWTSLGATTDGWRGFLKSGTKIYGATSSGLRISTDSGASWGSVVSGLPAGVNGLAIRDGILFTGATTGGTYIYQTVDDGATSLYDYRGTSVATSGGRLRFSEVGARRYKKLNGGPAIGGVGIPWDSLIADVIFSQTPVYVGSGTDSTFDIAIIGWHCDRSNYLTCEINNLTGSVYFRGAYKGVAFASSASWITTTQTMRLALTWDGLVASLWVYSNDQWLPSVSYRVPSQTNGAQGSVDPMFWSFEGWSRTVGAYCSVASSVLSFERVEVAATGRVGLRDINTVTYENGEPVTDAQQRVYVTATVAPANLVGSSLNSIHAAHCGVFLYDPATRALSNEVGRVYTRHASSNGYVATRGNSPIKIVCDRTSHQWMLLISDWSDGGKNIRIVKQAASPLRGASLVSASEILLSSPNSSTYCYDADLIYSDGLWRMVCTWGAVNGNNVLLSATTIDGLKTATKTILTSAGEGSRFMRISGVWYINIVGVVRDINGSAISAFPYLDVDLTKTGQGTPHITMFPVSDAGGTRYVILSFDGNQFNSVASSMTNGAMCVWESQPVSGVEAF